MPPNSDHFVDITWEEAVNRIAKQIRKVRDETWIATQKLREVEVPVNRTDAIAIVTQVLVSSPDHRNALALRGRYYSEARQDAKAVEDFSKLLKTLLADLCAMRSKATR